jgi:5-hydroxyisourate hydrolase-like protein (transthyretin family)
MQRPEAATQFPAQSTLTVSVVDAAGKPVSGVPVSFEVAQNSTLQGMLDITPKQTTTGADGKVQATIMPSTAATTGSGHVLVLVDDKIEAVALTLERSKVRNTQ